MTCDRIRVGIIGVGRIAVNRHIPDMGTAGAEVVALADAAPGRAARFAQQFGVPRAYEDYRDLLALPDIDAVTITVPPFLHEEITIAALEAGKHVCLEKPPAMNAAQMIRMVAAGHKAGRLLMVGSQLVYRNNVQLLKRYIDAGELGEIYMAKTLSNGRRGAIPHGWYRLKAVAGGDAAIDGTSHALDRLLYLLGTPNPVSVVARTYDKFKNHPSDSPYLGMDIAEGRGPEEPVSEVEDMAVAFIQFDNGLALLHENTRTSNMAPSNGLWLYGTKAGAHLDPLAIYGETPWGAPLDTTPALGDEPLSHVPMFRHFLECIREGKETMSPGERAIVLMRIVDAIYQSQELGGRQVLLG